MNFADQTPDQQAHIVGRAWQAIGLDPGSITDHLMAEWIDGLHPLTIDEIKRGVDACKANKRTEPIDLFVKLCRQPEPSTAVSKMPLIEAGTETKAESYRKLNLHIRWGAL